MNTPEVSTNSEPNPAAATHSDGNRLDVTPGSSPSDPSLSRGLRLAALTLGAGLLAGVGSWLIGEATVSVFNPPRTPFEMMGQTLFKARFEDQLAADAKNATLAFAVLGGLLGLSLGVAGGLAWRSTRAGATAGGFGLVLGVLVACGVSLLILPIYYRAVERSPEEMSHDVLLPLLVHGGIWSACGLSGGVAFGIGIGKGRGRLTNAALGGLIGGALGAVLYEIVGVVLFADSKTTNPISLTWHTRLLARLLVATLAGMLVAAVVNMPGRHPVGLKPSR